MCNINTNIGLTYKTAPCNHNSKPSTKQSIQSKCKNPKTDIKKPDGKAISLLKLHIYFFVIDEMANMLFFQISWSTKNKTAVSSFFLQKQSKIILIPLNYLNGLGVACAKGTDCSDDQICDELKCVSCKEDSKPDEDREKCEPTSNNGEPNCGDKFNIILLLLTVWIFLFTHFWNGMKIKNAWFTL